MAGLIIRATGANDALVVHPQPLNGHEHMKTEIDYNANSSISNSATFSAQNPIPAQAKRGRGKSQNVVELINASVEILREIQPATVRAVCYRLFTAGLIPNMSKNSTGKVSKHLVWARENGCIDWTWIVDETREAERIASWANPNSIIDSAVGQYRRNNWSDQPHRIEVWSEKGTVRGTLAPILKKYGLTFRVMHGFGSASALHDIAEESRESVKPLTILYVGDFDPSGMCMSELDIPQRIARYSGRATIRRIALTANDVAPGTTLPCFDADSKKSDSRHQWFVTRYGTRCWELDALSPVDLRERVEQAVIGMMDADAWNHSCAIEQVEIDAMQTYAVSWKASISRLAAKCVGEMS